MSAESDLKDLFAQASAAYQIGRPTFIACIKTGTWGLSTGQMGQWMDAIDAVEAAGWQLHTWETSANAGGGFMAFPLFRRRDDASSGLFAGPPTRVAPTTPPGPVAYPPRSDGPQDRR